MTCHFSGTTRERRSYGKQWRDHPFMTSISVATTTYQKPVSQSVDEVELWSTHNYCSGTLVFDCWVHWTDFVFCAPVFHLPHCFRCIPCNTNLLLTIPVVVTSILIVHFDICIFPKYILDCSWGKWGRGSFMKGGMSPILTLYLGNRSHCIWGIGVNDAAFCHCLLMI